MRCALIDRTMGRRSFDPSARVSEEETRTTLTHNDIRTVAPAWLLERRATADRAARARPLAAGVRRTDIDAGGVRAALFEQEDVHGPVVFYIHGGGFRSGSLETYAFYASNLAVELAASVFVVDYPLAPEQSFPAAIDAVTAAYHWVLDQHTPPEQILVAGESAGGGLAAALLLREASRGNSLPSGTALISPWLDLTCTAPSYQECAATELYFPYEAAVEASQWYLGGHDPRDPVASPLFGSWRNQPPIFLQASDSEVLRDDAVRFASTARGDGVDVRFRLHQGAPHAWPVSAPDSTATNELLADLRMFVHEVAAAKRGRL